MEPTGESRVGLEKPMKMQNEKVSILRDIHCGPVAKTSLPQGNEIPHAGTQSSHASTKSWHVKLKIPHATMKSKIPHATTKWRSHFIYIK